MAKTPEEIKELLSSSLFVEGQKSNYISISQKGDSSYINTIARIVQPKES